MLVLCTLLWSVSFPTMKSLVLTQQTMLPQGSSWFFASLCVVYRFGLSAVLIFLVTLPTIAKLTRLEVWQGVGLGIFGGGGILLQIDGLSYTAASTSAFLTQCYSLFIPLWFAGRQRRWPKLAVCASCILVMAGVAILSKLSWHDLRLGRGELETIAASVFFTGQILWLARPEYSRNNANHFSTIMFAVMAAVCMPVAILTTPELSYWWRAYWPSANWGFLVILVLCCTMGGYMLMNYWQQYVPPVQAGLIYCLEPVFASGFAMFLPAWFSAWTGIHYANESLTFSLVSGGGLIIVANAIIQKQGTAG
jgi:drug/metabolite transporter (DMT)-like permease